MGDANSLIASFFWGAIGSGFSLYAAKQKEWVPALGGLALMIISYFIDDALWMSVAGVAIVAAIFWFRGRF
jgi:hypothetical protein